MTSGRYWLPEAQARNFAEALAYRRGALALLLTGGNATPGRLVTRYEVEPYPGIRDAWGVVERWRYSDRPDLPEFGSGFIDVPTLTRLAGAAPRCANCRRLLNRGAGCRACAVTTNGRTATDG